MKPHKYIIALILTLTAVTILYFANYTQSNILLYQEEINGLKRQIDSLSLKIDSTESQLQDTMTCTISLADKHERYEAEFYEYQQEVDHIRNNLNDFNNLWRALFSYEQEQYMMRGR